VSRLGVYMATLSRLTLQKLAVHDVIEGGDLRARGVSRPQLRTMLAREHLFRAYQDVFLTTDRPTREGRWLAAVRHCGPDALLSHQAAAVLWRLIEWEGGPHVTVPNHRITKPPVGIRVHRSRRPDAGWTRDGIPVTTLHRTIDDIARGAPVPFLKAAVGRAEREHAVDLAALYADATSANLKRVLATYVAGRGLTDSELEARFYELVATTSLGRPQMQRRHAGGRVDFVWPDLRLIVEVDGYESHRGAVGFQEDRRRDRQNRRAGFDTLRLTWSDVVLTPADVAADLEHAHVSLSRLAVDISTA
jgi:very-short-patch-repair endonuclease